MPLESYIPVPLKGFYFKKPLVKYLYNNTICLIQQFILPLPMHRNYEDGYASFIFVSVACIGLNRW